MLKDFTKEKFDIIITAGQSNAEGTGIGEADYPYEPSDRIWHLNADMTVTVAAERAFRNEIMSNFGVYFARRYIASEMLADDRKLLIVRAVAGGTGFASGNWGMNDGCYLNMMEMIRTALSLNSENRIVAFLWHQGESDAMFHVNYDTHYGNLRRLIESVKVAFNVPDMPIVAADFVQKWKNDNIADAEPVAEAIKAVCRDLGGEFVETDGLLSNCEEHGRSIFDCDDIIQFSRRSLEKLGVRYFDAYKKLIRA